MLKANIAEWLLSLTTTPERAASTAGDLLQEADKRGPAWFWISLVRTAGGLVWNNVLESPMRLTGLAILSFVFSIIYFMPIALIIVAGQVLIVGTVLGVQDLLVRPETLVPSEAVMALDAAVAIMVSSLMMGSWLTRWAPRRELAVTLVAWVGFRVVWISVSLLWPSVITPWGPVDVALDLALTAGALLFTFAGIERSRRRLAKIRLSSR
jgi:hypothetical protein